MRQRALLAGGSLLTMRLVPLALLASAIVGCAKYDFDLVEPPDLARRISTSEVTIAVEPLQYRMQSYENRLVMRVFNPADERIALLGPESSVVDPEGQSHPLQTQTIAPGSFIKLILPPLRPRLDRMGPSIGFGVGVRASRSPEPGYLPPEEPPQEDPRYLASFDGSSTFFWDWPGETRVRVNLVYQRDEQVLLHEFVFHRRKR